MMVSLRLANVMLVVMSTLFAMSLQTNVLFVMYSYIGVVLAGLLVGAATPRDQRPKWLR
jgi:hypothetical protein